MNTTENNSDRNKPEDQQPTAFKNMDTGAVVPHGDSMHDEGKTTSDVNRATDDRVDDDADTLRNSR